MVCINMHALRAHFTGEIIMSEPKKYSPLKAIALSLGIAFAPAAVAVTAATPAKAESLPACMKKLHNTPVLYNDGKKWAILPMPGDEAKRGIACDGVTDHAVISQQRAAAVKARGAVCMVEDIDGPGLTLNAEQRGAQAAGIRVCTGSDVKAGDNLFDVMSHATRGWPKASRGLGWQLAN